MRKLAYEPYGLWYKSNYCLEDQNGQKIITSSGINEPIPYDPLEYSILYKRPKESSDHANASPFSALAKLNIKEENDILIFVNKWGLLGLWNEKDYKGATELPQINGRDFSQWFRHPHKTGRSAYQEPLTVFIKAVEDFQKFVNDIEQFVELVKKNNSISENTLKRIIHEMENHENQGMSIEQFAYKYGFLIDEVKSVEEEARKSLIIDLKLRSVKECITPIDRWDIEKRTFVSTWKADSLLSMVYKSTIEQLHAGRTILRCKWENCKTPFITENPRNKFCKDQCKVSYFTRQSNLKSWANELYVSFPSISKDRLDKELQLLTQEKGVGIKKVKERINQLIKDGSF